MSLLLNKFYNGFQAYMCCSIDELTAGTLVYHNYLIKSIFSLYRYSDTISSHIPPWLGVPMSFVLLWIIINMIFGTIHTFIIFNWRQWIEIEKSAIQLLVRKFIKTSGFYLLEPHPDYKNIIIGQDPSNDLTMRNYISLQKKDKLQGLELLQTLSKIIGLYISGIYYNRFIIHILYKSNIISKDQHNILLKGGKRMPPDQYDELIHKIRE